MTTKVPSRQITSGAATLGQVLTADGVGGSFFQSVAAPVLSVFTVTTAQTYTPATTLTFPHGLGVRPKLFWCEAICKTAIGKLNVGDSFIVSGYGGFNGAANNTHGDVRANATNVYLDLSANWLYYNGTIVPPANVDIVAKILN